MADINPSIVGEAYKQYVKDQIKVRQKVHASGLGTDNRTPEQISYLNSRNAWIKCASSVSVEDSKRLSDVGLPESLKGVELAKKFVLFNGISEYNNPQSFRGGYSQNSDNPETEDLIENAIPDTLYGVGGLEFGQQPMPGILEFSITHNDIGSIRFGQLKIRANNKQQFEILELLYIRLGYTIFIEWGNNMYYENPDEPTLKYTGLDTTTLIEDGTWFEPPAELLTHLGFYSKIEEKREAFKGNYEAFFGRVVNFDWTFNPSGYYEIDLVLRDLGDVVESFKVNALTKKNTIPILTKDGETIQSEANQSDIRNYLYCLNNTLVEDNPFNLEENNSDFVNVTEAFKSEPVTTSTGGSTARNPGISLQPNLQYVRLGTFLEWIENNVICHITNQSQTFPMVTISTSAANYMRIFPGLVSTDPLTCIIKNEFLGSFEEQKIGSNKIHDQIFSSFRSINIPIDPYKGKIMDIYLHIGKLEDTFKALLKSSPTVDVDLLTLLNAVLNLINKCFGGYIDLQAGIQEGNILVIRDTKLESRTNTEGERFEKEEEDKEGIIKVFGYNPDSMESNFVKDFRFNTRISNRLAAQISIGAASNRTNTSNISGFFENLNKGLKDRFQEKTEDNNSEEEKKAFLESCRVGEADKEIKPSKKFKYTGIPGSGFGKSFSTASPQPAVEQEQEEDQTDLEVARENLSEASETYFQLLSFLFGTEKGNSQYDPKYYQYFKAAGDRTVSGERLSSALQKWLGASKVYLEKKTGSSLSSTTLGFIPIDITLVLDGISGIKIYNQLSIDSSFLPKPYPDIIDFVIMNVSHRVLNNSWETEIRAISKPNIAKSDMQAVNEEIASEVEEDNPLDSIEEETPPTFFPPLGSLPFNVRNDSRGQGAFGTSRDSDAGTHRGIDLVTTVPNSFDIELFRDYPALATNAKNAVTQPPSPGVIPTGTVANTLSVNPTLYTGKGSQIFAPINGSLIFTKGDSESVLPGLKIVGTGDYIGYTVYIFYAAPLLNKLYRSVTKGEYIANAVQLDLQKNYQGVSNHIHYAIKKRGQITDPNELEYSLEK